MRRGQSFEQLMREGNREEEEEEENRRRRDGIG